MTLSSGSILLGVICLYLYSQGSILLLTWLSITTLESFRALRIVRQNGRRIGIATRRKALRQALMGWIILCVVSQVEPLISAVLDWLPFYSPIKWVISIAFLAVRIPASTAIYISAIRPVLKRYEKPIDLILLLLHSIFQLLVYFTILRPLDCLLNVGQSAYMSVIGWNARRTKNTLGTASSPIIINDELKNHKAHIKVTLPSDISLSTLNVPGRLVSSARKRPAPARSRPISRAQIGECSRTPEASKVAMPACDIEDNHEDATPLNSGQITIPPKLGLSPILPDYQAPLGLEQVDPLASPRTSLSGQKWTQNPKLSETPSTRALETEASPSRRRSDRKAGLKAEPLPVPKRSRHTVQGNLERGRLATASSTTTRPNTSVYTFEAPIHPGVKPIYPPLPPPATSKTITTTTSISRKRPLPPDIIDVEAETTQPPVRTRRKLGPPVRVLLDPPKSTASTRQSAFASSRSSNLPNPSSSTVKQAKEISTRPTIAPKGITRPKVLSNKNGIPSSDQQVISKQGLPDQESTAGKVGSKRQAIGRLENPTMKRVRKTV